jgi:hypothetical protein
MSEKTFKIVDGDISDGYHTFDELYEHRCLLFINWMISGGAPGPVRWVADHFDGWDLIFCNTARGQISYHVPNTLRPIYEPQLEQVSDNAEFDGHTSRDVIERLKKLGPL